MTFFPVRFLLFIVVVLSFLHSKNIRIMSYNIHHGRGTDGKVDLGRIANFINGELFGRIAIDLPWSMIFPYGGDLPRHPSQIYEALLEGLLLFTILFFAIRKFLILKKKGFFMRKSTSY